jgi:hypothetical protein
MQTILNHEPEENRDRASYSNRAHTSSALLPTRTAAQPVSPVVQLWQSIRGWLIVGLLLVIQFGLFYQFAQREVVWAYPTNYDQNVDLMGSYVTYENVLTDGFLPGLLDGLLIPSPRGTLLYPQASILFLLLGPSRMSALTLNFAYFALFQCVFVWSLRWLATRWSIALLGLGLLLTVTTPFFWVGGLMDFRIDFIAFCLFGVLICLVIRSRMFASWRWSLVVGAVATLLILSRLLTIVYIGGIFGLFFLFLCARLWLQRRDLIVYRSLKQQLYSLLMAGCVIFIICMPYLWYNRKNVVDYYIVGHIVSSEKEFRAQAMGVFNLTDSILFYPRSVIFDHAGMTFMILTALVIIVSCLFFWKYMKYTQQDLGKSRLDVKSTYFFVITSIIVPYTVLTIDVAKSPVVGDIIVPSLLWFVLITVITLSKIYDNRSDYPVKLYALNALTILVLCFGLYTQFEELSKRGRLNGNRADVEKVLQLHNSLFRYIRELNQEKTVISTDKTTDYFNNSVLKSVIYERHGVLLNTQSALGSQPFTPVTLTEAVDLLETSDFALMTISDGMQSSFPFDRSIQTIQPELMAYCDQHFLPLEYFRFFNRDMILYTRLEPRVEGLLGGWITSDGLTLHHLGRVFQERPTIELRGTTNFRWLSKIPDVQAQVVQPTRSPKTIPATIKTSGNKYTITLHIDPKDIDGDRAVQVHLLFDTYFVPKDIGINSDTRRLVIKAPQEISLQP